MNRQLLFAMMLGCAALAAPLSLRAAEATPATAEGIVGDSEFLRRAHAVTTAQLKLSELARVQGVDSEVRNLAERMLGDNNRNYDQLLALAKAKGVDLPTALEGSYQLQLDDLKNKTGTDFDRAFVDASRSNHAAMLGLFQTTARTANDPEIRKFAAERASSVQAYLDRAEQLQRR